MLDELSEIDTSSLDELAQITKQLIRLKKYCAEAEHLKNEVDPVVFERVVADYHQQRATLERQAEPLTVEARAMHQQLTALLTQLKQSVDDALLNKQELEFRCKVGELDEHELTTQLADLEGALTQSQTKFAEVGALNTRCLEALGSEVDFSKTILAALPTSPDTSDEATRVQPPPKPPPGRAAYDEESETVLLPSAVLVLDVEGATPKEFSLGTTNSIGSGHENQVRVKRLGVSGRHALITVDLEGFAIQDLGSRNGTYVNGHRIDQHALANGDRIRVGKATLIFRISGTSAA